ncbi:MAG: tRNA (adenosine(37)-N6)-threonylcarbamoyltransferase complex ATPase subunit type 1 TsaE [Patescibacteria group bacterium]
MIIELAHSNTFAKEILSKISAKADGAYIVFLSGDLGSGKTTTTKSIAYELGIQEDITSPTFVILKRYEIEKGEFKNLIHVDAYRLKGYTELQRIKFEEYMKDSQNLILLEWPEMVESENLKADMTIVFSYGEKEGERIVEIK